MEKQPNDNGSNFQDACLGSVVEDVWFQGFMGEFLGWVHTASACSGQLRAAATVCLPTAWGSKMRAQGAGFTYGV